MKLCRLCRIESVLELLDLGLQPICNRFLENPSDEEYMHPMIVGQCNSCGLIQLINPAPVSEVLPRYEWITYNEPEEHLNRLSEIISNLPGLTKEASICGVSFKDDSTLKRLERIGFKHTYRISMEDDLGIKDHRAGAETIQSRMTPDTADKIVNKHGIFDVVIVRHIFEHAYDTLGFLQGVKRLVKPHGYIVFEVPDCMKSLEKDDYTTLWEEHIVYFTPETFRHCFAFAGFSLTRFESYPYPFEDSLVGIVRIRNGVANPFPPGDVLYNERRTAQGYVEGLPGHISKIKRFLSEFRQNKGRIVLFGAGHLACTFINLLELKDLIEFVVDDNPNKGGLFMPGSKLPIYESSMLVKEDIKLCLLSLSPQSEDKVIQRNIDFLEHGGSFFSIFPASKHALQV